MIQSQDRKLKAIKKKERRKRGSKKKERTSKKKKKPKIRKLKNEDKEGRRKT